MGGDDAVGVELAVAIFERPLNERPEVFGDFAVAACEAETSSAVGDHSVVAAVASAVPDAGGFGDDGGWDRAKVGVHETSEEAVGVERGFVGVGISLEGEEWAGVFGLIVGPDGGVVAAAGAGAVESAAGAVHQAGFGGKDAFAGANLGEGKHSIEDWIWGL